MNLTVLKAIFKRDFVNYFSNATGYVFICVFVVLSSLAAFWPDEFFSNNLANLDQLTKWMPFILLVFVPAITMSSWAEERRRGTDELLLTLPATDSDVVLGKYLANVAIFTVSLLFSLASILLIFKYGLGSPDLGLFLCTYLGYWMVGLAMIATGMVASFLTSNLTVGFILGMLFNAPQALATFVSDVVDYLAALPVVKLVAEKEWFRDLAEGAASAFSAFDGFSDFSRGVVSLSGVLHFLSIVVLMLYICMVLIGRRHWSGGADGPSLGWHYLVRGVALFLVITGVGALLKNHDSVRLDLTTARLNSLSPQTLKLARQLGKEKDVPPIKIDAYVSPRVPSEYAAQKRELLSTLDELKSAGGGKITVSTHVIENFSEEATRAERTFGIEPRSVTTRVRGATEQEDIFLGAAFSCGLDKVVIPFFDKGIPVEYELVRSITTVADQKRKRVGVVKTDVSLFSSFSMQGPTSESQLVTELKKQYDVTEVDPAQPITDTYDVLIAVQPSSLSPEAMENFVAAVKSGQPTAIFEDPLPVAWGGVVGTGEPKQAGGGMMGMFGGGQPVPKGDIQQLWKLLGVEMNAQDLIWQKYNPYPQNAGVDPEWIFVDTDSGAPEAFSEESPITAGLKQALFLFAGSVKNTPGSKTESLPLAVTNDLTGTIPVREAQGMLRGMMSPFQMEAARSRTGRTYVVAAHITGKVEKQEETKLNESIDEEALRAELEGESDSELDSTEAGAEEEAPEDAAEENPQVNVVFVSDIDCVANDFFTIRALGDDDQLLIDWRMQNVTFVLNVLDQLAGDDRYIELRKRTRDYRTLAQIEESTVEYRESSLKRDQEFIDKFQEELEAAQKNMRDQIAKIEDRTDLTPVIKRQLRDQEEIRQNKMLEVKVRALEQERNRNVRKNRRDLQASVRSVQDLYKFAAVIVPPILPILLALWVFFRRRSMEQEGVAKERLRYSKPQSRTPAAAP